MLNFLKILLLKIELTSKNDEYFGLIINIQKSKYLESLFACNVHEKISFFKKNCMIFSPHGVCHPDNVSE